jgi:integrase
MPNVRTPSLRQNADGRWITKWGGRIRYLGRDETEARHRYAIELTQWARWKEAGRQAQLATSTTQYVPLISELEDAFLSAKMAEGGPKLRQYYAKHLRRFCAAYGTVAADRIRAAHLNAVKEDLLVAGYARKTVNHDLGCIKTMMSYGYDNELTPTVSLRACRKLSLDPPKDKSLTIERVREMMAQCQTDVRPWLMVNYLTLARPSEVVRMVQRQGTWESLGVLRLTAHKTSRKTSMPRHVVYSCHALMWLNRCRPIWKTLSAYSQAVRSSLGPGGPGALRHSAATHLLELGVDRASVDLLLGHLPSRVSLTYGRIDWRGLSSVTAKLRV